MQVAEQRDAVAGAAAAPTARKGGPEAAEAEAYGIPRRRGRAGRRQQSIAYVYLLPALAIYTLFLLVPLGHSAWISLYRWDGLSPGTWVGLHNYADAFTDPQLRASFVHSLVLIVFYAIIPVGIGLLLAGVIVRAPRLRFLSAFRVVLFLPQVVASVVVATTWSMIMAPEGVLNDVLSAVGLGSLTNDWLGDFSTALPAVGLIGTWTEIGLCLVLFLAGIGQIPRELYEAARLDGAGPVAEFFAVTLPGLRRQVVIALALTVTAALRNFDVIFVTTRGGPGTATTVPAFQVYHQAFEANAVGSASAIGITLLVIIGVLVAAINRLDVRDS
ncbi:MAG TPA: sugar ABC transporter permease [Baekduia sp.]|uniref:carbohydrate ABC transporter permease n=1 Tax=Baekduia sp. TaxID=2600305 RepID=UPI002D78EFBC|nr:sugar ABC transporter permease [Baekduia sp.]HET6507093.1 sugar ABC transporter permease [Baekduia sp.]